MGDPPTVKVTTTQGRWLSQSEGCAYPIRMVLPQCGAAYPVMVVLPQCGGAYPVRVELSH